MRPAVIRPTLMHLDCCHSPYTHLPVQPPNIGRFFSMAQQRIFTLPSWHSFSVFLSLSLSSILLSSFFSVPSTKSSTESSSSLRQRETLSHTNRHTHTQTHVHTTLTCRRLRGDFSSTSIRFIVALFFVFRLAHEIREIEPHIFGYFLSAHKRNRMESDILNK